MFSWLRNRRRRRILAEPFPPHWDAVLRRNIAHYLRLSSDEQAKLRDVLRILIAEKGWEPARGFHVTEEMKLTIAAQAALMLIGMQKHDYFAGVTSIVIHPGEFRLPDPDDPTVQDELSEDLVDGQSNYQGPIVVGWNQARDEAFNPEDGFNVVIHEFAHQFYILDDHTDARPILSSRTEETHWADVMMAAQDNHRKLLNRGEEPFFPEQAEENESEFFSYASEAFFCRPHDLIDEEPDVYEILAKFYGVDPQQWFPE